MSERQPKFVSRPEHGPHSSEVKPETSGVIAIYAAENFGGPMLFHESVMLTAFGGIASDRYNNDNLPLPRTGRQGCNTDQKEGNVTIITLEELNEINILLDRNGIIPLTAKEMRRNIIINTPKETLRENNRFRLGQVDFEIITATGSCSRIGKLAGRKLMESKKIAKIIKDRGGIKARAINGGKISIGNCYQPISA